MTAISNIPGTTVFSTTAPTSDLTQGVSDELEYSVFAAEMASPTTTALPADSILNTLDRSRASMQQSLDLVIQQPTAKNMFAATRQMSEFDLQMLVLGKVVDKTTKGIDRMLNLQ